MSIYDYFITINVKHLLMSDEEAEQFVREVLAAKI